MLHSSVAQFPSDASTLKDVGIPFGCVVQPLAPVEFAEVDCDADDVGRCVNCGAYINRFCDLLRREWRCSVCGRTSPLGPRYSGAGNRDRAEFHESVYDAVFTVGEEDHDTPPVYIAVVDGTAGGAFLDLVRAALHAGLAALPPDALLGLIVYSDTISIHMLGSARPHVRHVPIPPTGEPLPLLDAVGIDRLLAHVNDDTRDAIATSIETIGRGADGGGDWDGEGGEGGEGDGKSGFGAVMRALADALADVPALSPPRLLLFLGSRPNYGPGALPPPGLLNEVSRDDEDAPAPSKASIAAGAFYSELAADLAQSGGAVFLYAISPRPAAARPPGAAALLGGAPLGLETLQSLVSTTGGVLSHYSSADECTMADDVYKQLRRPFASRGLLRLRTSPEVRVGMAYGPAHKDTVVTNLYHLAGCHDETALAFTLEFTSATGFAEQHDARCVLQLAFVYTETLLVDDDDRAVGGGGGGAGAGGDCSGGDGGGGSSAGCARPPNAAPPAKHWVRVRRLRVHTHVCRIARNTRQLYECIDERVLMALLTHKVLAASAAEGFREGRLLLQDWLIVFLSKYQQHYGAHPENILHPERMCASISMLPQWVYGLLRGPLLSSNTPLSSHVMTPDARTAMHALYGTLPHADLALTSMPALHAYASEELRGGGDEELPLSWDALEESQCRLFVLDTYTHIYVYSWTGGAGAGAGAGVGAGAGSGAASAVGAGGADDALPFPPSKASMLWKEVLALKQQRLRTPKVVCCTSATPDGRLFESYLDGDGGPAPAASVGATTATGTGEVAIGVVEEERFSFDQFLCFLRDEVVSANSIS